MVNGVQARRSVKVRIDPDYIMYNIYISVLKEMLQWIVSAMTVNVFLNSNKLSKLYM